LEFGDVDFCGGKENPEGAQRNTLGARREPTTNSSRVWHRAGIEPGPHWWEASALTTAPSCSPKNEKNQREKGYLEQSFRDIE